MKNSFFLLQFIPILSPVFTSSSHTTPVSFPVNKRGECLFTVLAINASASLPFPLFSIFYRVLILLWLYTDSPEVLADLRCCMFSIIATERKHDNIVGYKIIDNILNPLTMESLDKKGDLLSAALENSSRFGRRLIQLVSVVATVGSCTSLKLKTAVFQNSRLPCPSEDLFVLEPLSVAQKLDLFCAALCAISHPATSEYKVVTPGVISVSI